MGATLLAGGATFRVWAPAARQVYVITDELPAARAGSWGPNEKDALVRQADDTWTGFVLGLSDGSAYRFWVEGEDRAGFKRDPFARELGSFPAFPDCDCLIRDPASYPWHDSGFQPPQFRDLILYQFHIGTFYGVDSQGRDTREARTARFLDLLYRIEYLRDLGVNAIQPLPVQEYPSEFSMGYNGTDYFSPETDYQVEDVNELQRYRQEANRLLAQHGLPPVSLEQIRPGPNQLKLIIDLCHLNGLAVLFDLVYNHAGGGFDDQSLYFFDRRRYTSNNDSLYFTDAGWAGGLVFAFWKKEVRQYLIENARFFLSEYHIDGIRFDEVSVIDRFGGWSFAQDLTSTLRYANPEAIQIAEYWNDWRWLAVTAPSGGLGFDAALSDRLRDTLRNVVREASYGSGARPDLSAVADALGAPPHFPGAWQAVHCVENHDIVYHDRREPRLVRLADGSNPRSWWARSRTRAATAVMLAAPGIPHLFMGQEFLEDKNWSDSPRLSRSTLIWWDGLSSDRHMQDHLTFTKDLLWLRRRLPVLRGEHVNPFHVHNDNRVLAFHRWLEGRGEDVVVVASFNDSTFWAYDLGIPWPGLWREIFNSDYYDHFPNAQAVGNAGGVAPDGPPMHGFGQSATVTIPANSVLILARA
jgi:1,4-alpha-glucan branching enzyme